MADQIRKHETGATELQTDAAVWNAIRYLDSPTDYREYLRGPLQQSDFVLLDNDSGQVWGTLRDVAVITFLVSIIVLLLLRT